MSNEARTALDTVEAFCSLEECPEPEWPAIAPDLLEQASRELGPEAHEADVRLWAAVLALYRSQEALEAASSMPPRRGGPVSRTEGPTP